MTRDELIEAMARKIWEQHEDEIDWSGIKSLAASGDAFMVGQVDWTRETAAIALAALEAARPEIAAVLRGEAAVVPREATEAMQDAVWLAAQLQNANAQYAAMIEAAQKEMGR